MNSLLVAWPCNVLTIEGRTCLSTTLDGYLLGTCDPRLRHRYLIKKLAEEAGVPLWRLTHNHFDRQRPELED